MEAISRIFCSLEEELGCHSINNQCFYYIFASCFLPKFYLYPSHCSTPSLLGIIILIFQSKCVLYYDSTVECHTQDYTIFSALAVCVLVIFIAFVQQFFSFCTPQDCSGGVSHVVYFEGGMLCTCLLNHFRDSTRMEPMVYSWLQDSFCIVPHPQDIDTVLVSKSPSFTLTCTHQYSKVHFFYVPFLYPCYHKTIQVKLHE